MHKSFFFAVAASVLFVGAATADLNGRSIQLTTGDQAGVHVPVEVAVDSNDTPAMISVACAETGARHAATLRTGTLTFLVETLPANADRDLTIMTSERPDNVPPRVIITKKPGDDVLDVHIDGVHFTSYHFGGQWRKPFLWPVNSEGGVGITRDYPMDDSSTPRLSRDHVHHKSFYTAYGDLNGHDLWAEGANAGTQRSGEVTFGSGDAYGWIRAANVWEDRDGNPVVNETREYRFYATPEEARFFDVRVVFAAGFGEVLFGDTKEGGIVSARMRPDISHARAVITNAHGDQGEQETWGKPSAWCDFSGDVPDVGWRGLAIFDHPDNLRHPTSWHVRNYGLMGANPFGYSYFVEREHNQGLIPDNGDYTLAGDDTLLFNYRIYVHSGNVEEAAVAERYADYAAPPEATLID